MKVTDSYVILGFKAAAEGLQEVAQDPSCPNDATEDFMQARYHILNALEKVEKQAFAEAMTGHQPGNVLKLPPRKKG